MVLNRAGMADIGCGLQNSREHHSYHGPCAFSSFPMSDLSNRARQPWRWNSLSLSWSHLIQKRQRNVHPPRAVYHYLLKAGFPDFSSSTDCWIHSPAPAGSDCTRGKITEARWWSSLRTAPRFTTASTSEPRTVCSRCDHLSSRNYDLCML